MSDLPAKISIERDGLQDLLLAVAMTRVTDAEAKRDRRFAVAARNIRLVADTLDQVGDAVWVDVAMLDVASEDMLSSLIAARLLAIAFDLPPVGCAPQFFAEFATMIETACRRLQ